MHIGERLFDFNLKSTSGEFVSNYDFADKYSFLIVVTCNHCKYSRAYWNRLKKLMADYEEDNLGIIAICGNDAKAYPQDSFEEMVQAAKTLKLPFPYLHDPDQSVMLKLGALRTPEVFLFNSQRELVYKGAIDDNWENENAVMSVHLLDAIEYSLDGLEVDYPEVPAVGCTIKWLPGNEPAVSE
ncbi:MAG: thioredoxin family protein [Bacteroidetes bacterium]|nr:thioredoxin family protein [Bacteroidota bacterium]